MPFNVKTEKCGMSRLDRLLILASVCIVALAMPACHADKPGSQELEAHAPDVTLHVRVAGDLESGNTLIAIHGGPGLSSHYMLNLERLAGPELAVVTYDQRGVSRSTSVPLDPANFELLAYVEDLEAMREAVGAESVHLLGHSWGGVVTLRYATVYPERVRSIVLANSGPPESNQQVTQLTWSAVEGFDLTSLVAELEHRVLLLWGEDDPCGLAVGESIEEALSAADVELVLLRDCGHFWHECPDQFFPQVHAFLGLPGEP